MGGMAAALSDEDIADLAACVPQQTISTGAVQKQAWLHVASSCLSVQGFLKGHVVLVLPVMDKPALAWLQRFFRH